MIRISLRRPLATAATIALFSLAGIAGCPFAGRDAQAAPPLVPHGQPEPDMLGVHWAKDHTPPPFARGGTQLLSYHNGPVIGSAAIEGGAGIEVKPIYWGAGWSSDPYQLQQSKPTFLAAFYGGVG